MMAMWKVLLAVGVIVGAASAQSSQPHYAVAGDIAAPDGRWDLLSVDPASHRLYVAQSDGVLAIDLATNTATANLVPSNRGHDAMAVPGSGLVIASNGGANTVTLFDGATGKIAATLPVGTRPDAIAWDPATRTAWVMTPGSGDISVVDPFKAKVLGSIAVGGSLELGAADGRGRMYVNVEDRNEVAVLDTRDRRVISRFPLAGCDGPTGIVFAQAANEIVSACANGVAIVSAPNGRLIATLPVGKGPDGAAYDARRRLAFVPSGADGTLSVIALGPKPKVVATVATAKGARTVALDPSTGRLYLPHAQYLPASGGGRPALAPGTFHVLVVAPS